MMIQVAGGILVAAFVLAVIAFGLAIAMNPDYRALGVNQRGWVVTAAGVAAAAGLVYLALAGIS